MNLSSVAKSVRRTQGLRMRLLSTEKGERIIGLAIDELPAGVFGEDAETYQFRGRWFRNENQRRIYVRRVRSLYREKFGFDPITWLLIFELVIMFLEWWINMRDRRELIERIRWERSNA